MTRRTINRSIWIAAAAGVVALSSCGKSSDQDGASASGKATQTVELKGLPINPVLEKAGFKATYHRRFPAQLPGSRASIVVYRAASGRDGGVLYLQDRGNEDRVVWHWYFDEEVPDSVTNVELNDDGLWDVRMYVGGKSRDYVQDQSFTLVAPQRADRVAMNGASSEPVSADAMSWLCFDGDTTTAWRAEFKAGRTFVELPAPLGIDDGILSVRLLGDSQPAACELQLDGKTVQKFELESTTDEQMIHLEPAAQGAKSLRMVIASMRSGAPEVAISELGLK